MAQPRVSCLQQVNDRSYIMGITRRANRERPLSTQAGRSAGPSERLKPDPQRPLVCIAMTTAGHAPQETSSETQSFQCPGRPERRVPRISPVAWQDRRRVRRERVGRCGLEIDDDAGAGQLCAVGLSNELLIRSALLAANAEAMICRLAAATGVHQAAGEVGGNPSYPKL
jgi:hypothetical protein